MWEQKKNVLLNHHWFQWHITCTQLNALKYECADVMNSDKKRNYINFIYAIVRREAEQCTLINCQPMLCTVSFVSNK